MNRIYLDLMPMNPVVAISSVGTEAVRKSADAVLIFPHYQPARCFPSSHIALPKKKYHFFIIIRVLGFGEIIQVLGFSEIWRDLAGKFIVRAKIQY